MNKQKVYIVEVGLTQFSSFFKAKAYELWNLLDSEDYTILMRESGYEWEEGEPRFYYVGDLKPRMKSKTIDLYENQEAAKRSKEAFERAKRMGLIKKKTTKKP